MCGGFVSVQKPSRVLGADAVSAIGVMRQDDAWACTTPCDAVGLRGTMSLGR